MAPKLAEAKCITAQHSPLTLILLPFHIVVNTLYIIGDPHRCIPIYSVGRQSQESVVPAFWAAQVGSSRNGNECIRERGEEYRAET